MRSLHSDNHLKVGGVKMIKFLFQNSCVGFLFLLLFSTKGLTLEALYEKSVLGSPVIKTLHEDHQRWRQEEHKQLDKILTFIEEYEDKPKNLKEKIKIGLEKDRSYFELFSKKLESLKVGGSEGLSYQLKSHKMGFSIDLALKLLETSFNDIIDGWFPEGHQITPPSINVVGNEDHIYASGRGRSLKLLLLRTTLELSKASSVASLRDVIKEDPKDSPFIQYTPLPSPFTYEGLEDSPYFIKGDKSQNFMAIIHNGYAFGGHRNELPKWCGPQDCSSFVTKYTGCCHPASTYHQALFYQLKCGYQFPNLPSIAKKWEEQSSSFAKDDYIVALGETLKPTKVQDIEKVLPGMVHAERNYKGIKTNNDIALLGAGGHTTFVIGVEGQGLEAKLYTMGANRDLEGSDIDFIYGIEERPLFSDPWENEKLVMYFDLQTN